MSWEIERFEISCDTRECDAVVIVEGVGKRREIPEGWGRTFERDGYACVESILCPSCWGAYREAKKKGEK